MVGLWGWESIHTISKILKIVLFSRSPLISSFPRSASIVHPDPICSVPTYPAQTCVDPPAIHHTGSQLKKRSESRSIFAHNFWAERESTSLGVGWIVRFHNPRHGFLHWAVVSAWRSRMDPRVRFRFAGRRTCRWTTPWRSCLRFVVHRWTGPSSHASCGLWVYTLHCVRAHRLWIRTSPSGAVLAEYRWICRLASTRCNPWWMYCILLRPRRKRTRRNFRRCRRPRWLDVHVAHSSLVSFCLCWTSQHKTRRICKLHQTSLDAQLVKAHAPWERFSTRNRCGADCNCCNEWSYYACNRGIVYGHSGGGNFYR